MNWVAEQGPIHAESLQLEAEVVLLGALKECGITQTELARRMGCTKGAISQFLSPNANLTLSTLANLMACMGYEVRLTKVKAEKAH